jgi:ribosomal protein S18 acetylase RimI-like enzyme
LNERPKVNCFQGRQGSRVVNYRQFRNTDPPKLVAVWNEAFDGRGVVRLRTSAPLERHAFAKPHFDPAGLVLAEENGEVVGFCHAGFGTNVEEKALDRKSGVICLLGVRPAFRRRGIGSELLHRGEGYLRDRGATQLFAGAMSPLDPFYLGMYGGSDLPGVLASDGVDAFLTKRGYRPLHTTLIYQRRLNQAIKTIDPRFVTYRQRFEVRVAPRLARMSWWQECVFGLVEPLEFFLEEKPGGKFAGRALAWEMEGFSWRWNLPSVGVSRLEIRDDLRCQGLGKFLLAQVLRAVQEQFFELAEIHVPESNEAALKVARGLGFEQVDVGRQYQRSGE